MIHDRDTIYSEQVDRTLEAMGLVVLKTPVRVPQANAFCERLIGTMRRECLDFVIALSERHLRAVLHVWVAHYNRGRPHASLGPGIPERCDLAPLLTGHRLPDGQSVTATSNSGRSSSRVPSHATSGETTFEWPSQVFEDHKHQRRQHARSSR